MVLSTMALTSFCPLHIMFPEAQLRSSPMAGSRLQARRIGTTVCAGEQNASEGHSDPPKLEPFSQSRLIHAMRERKFLQKAEDALNDKCMALEGEDAWQCWEALSDFENIKEEAETECKLAEPGDRETACEHLNRFENMVRQSGGVNSLIDNVRMVAMVKENKERKAPPDEEEWLKAVSAAGDEVDTPVHEHEFLEDGGLPKSAQELKEDIEALLPESQFTRFFKRMGHHSNS